MGDSHTNLRAACRGTIYTQTVTDFKEAHLKKRYLSLVPMKSTWIRTTIKLQRPFILLKLGPFRADVSCSLQVDKWSVLFRIMKIHMLKEFYLFNRRG